MLAEKPSSDETIEILVTPMSVDNEFTEDLRNAPLVSIFPQ